MNVQVTTQLAVFVSNKPGALAELCAILAAAKLNIYAITTSDTIDHSVDRLVVDKPGEALRLLEKHGLLVLKTEVLMIEGANQSGSLAEISKKLADAKINIEYAYSATSPSAPRGVLILRPSSIPKALKLLNKR
jgi:hypothetical protein